MQVIVHHWPFTGFGAGQNVGHASIEVVGVPDCYISWWPTSERSYKVPAHGKLPDAVRGVTSFLYSAPANPGQSHALDTQLEGAPSTKIEVHGLQGLAIKTWWDAFRAAPPAWSALDVNCAMVSAYALRAGGADGMLVGISGWWRSWNIVWSPNDVARLAREINAGYATSRR